MSYLDMIVKWLLLEVNNPTVYVQFKIILVTDREKLGQVWRKHRAEETTLYLSVLQNMDSNNVII